MNNSLSEVLKKTNRKRKEMKRIIPKQKELANNNSIEYLHGKTQRWTTEIQFILVEQKFLKELLEDHIMNLCDTQSFAKGKLLLNGLNHEANLGVELIESIKEHKINLALLIENIYLKRERIFRENHDFLKIEFRNYIENFRCIKELLFELVLQMLKKEKNSTGIF